MMIRRMMHGLWPVLLILVFSVAAQAGPRDEIVASTESILESLRDKNLDTEVRRQRIRDVVHTRFDFRAMSQKTLGKNWKKANPEQQKRFVEMFASLLEGAYLGRLEAYTNEKVEYGKEKVRGKKALVKTGVVTKTVTIPIDYKLYDRGDGWYIYDVVVEEVSLIRNYRSSYREIIGKEGFDGLLTRMETKLARRETPGKAGNP